jgi:hypothetical protein
MRSGVLMKARKPKKLKAFFSIPQNVVQKNVPPPPKTSWIPPEAGELIGTRYGDHRWLAVVVTTTKSTSGDSLITVMNGEGAKEIPLNQIRRFQ